MVTGWSLSLSLWWWSWGGAGRGRGLAVIVAARLVVVAGWWWWSQGGGGGRRAVVAVVTGWWWWSQGADCGRAVVVVVAEMLVVAVIFIVGGRHGSGPSMVSKVQIQFTKEATHQRAKGRHWRGQMRATTVATRVLKSRGYIISEIDMQLTLTLESRGQVLSEGPNPAHHGRRRGERRRRKVGGV